MIRGQLPKEKLKIMAHKFTYNYLGNGCVQVTSLETGVVTKMRTAPETYESLGGKIDLGQFSTEELATLSKEALFNRAKR